VVDKERSLGCWTVVVRGGYPGGLRWARQGQPAGYEGVKGSAKEAKTLRRATPKGRRRVFWRAEKEDG